MSVASAWQTAAEVSTTLGTVVALIGVVITLIMTLRSEKLTREGQDLERKQAESGAARAEAAAALTEEYTRRVVLALEQMAAAGPATDLAPSSTRAAWSLVHFGGDTYKLENIGNQRAEDVTISADETLHLVDPPPPQTIEPGEAVTFMAAVSLGTRDTTITVTWMDPDGETSVWKYPLPPRPPR